VAQKLTPQQRRRKELLVKWKTARAEVLQRDKYVCMVCGESATCVNHVLGRKYKSLFLSKKYLMASCQECNQSDQADTVEERQKRIAILYSEYDYDYSDCPDKQYLMLIE